MNRPKIAVITGASRGIGKALALCAAQQGYHVALCSRRHTQELAETAAKIQAMGRECLLFQGDMGNAEEVAAFFTQIKDRFHRVDLLINNAGISHIGLLQDMTTEEWNEIVQCNLSSVFYCCKHTIPLMLQEHKGKILNISSVWGEVGAAAEVAYSATKGGVNAFTKALAKELAPSGIQVNALSLGYVDTSMNQHLTEEEQEELFAEIPIGRPTNPEEVAIFALQIAESPEYFTGQILRFDGSWI